MSKDPIVIVGSGLAGYTVAREFRKLDQETPLTVISRDSGAFYSKPMLSNAFLQGKDAAALVSYTAEQMAAQLNAQVLCHAEVTTINTWDHSITLRGERLPYRSLVLAVGSDQRPVLLPGDGVGDIISVNDLDDYARLRAALRERGRVAILGAGLIGCEFANDLASAGFEVALIDPSPWPLSRLLPAAQGQAMAAALAQAGVTLMLERLPLSVERSGKGYRLQMSFGEAVEADVVVSAIGLSPRIGLAKQAGLMVAQGIVADRWLRTSASEVYALGDCAEVDGLVLPYVLPVMQGARALARTLNGTPTRVAYPVMPVVVKTPALPAVVAPPLADDRQGRWQAALPGDGGGSHEGVWEYRNHRNELSGFALIGEHVRQRQQMLAGLPPWRS